MKKEYINPTTEIIMIETSQMMAGSETFSLHSEDEEYEESLDGPQLSRGRSVWDVDEEEW